MIKWDTQWGEVLSLFLLVLGFILSVLLQNPTLSYITILLAGLIAGRLYYIKRYSEPIFPFIMIIIGFLLGYLVGNFWSSRLFSLILFAVGFVVSYYLHFKKIVATFKSENFIK